MTENKLKALILMKFLFVFFVFAAVSTPPVCSATTLDEGLVCDDYSDASASTVLEGALDSILEIDERCESALIASDPVFAADYLEYLSTLQDPGKKPVVTLYRTCCGEDCTLGEMYLDGKLVCYTLELPDKGNKRNVSCIPAGTYNCEPWNSKKFPNTFHVENVNGRTAILIHKGNSTKDTSGCILVGLTQRAGWVGDSKKAMAALNKAIGRCGFTLKIVNGNSPDQIN